MKYKVFVIAILSMIISVAAMPTKPHLSLALLKYHGGGDWYANPTSLSNLALFCNSQLHTEFTVDPVTVEVGSAELFNQPLVHMTGHGNVVFNDSEAKNLRTYLIGGGFLHIDDNYGMDPFVRPAMKSVFPELDFIEIPFDHEIYHQTFDFANGLPKIHKHDEKAPRGYGLFYKGKLVCYYSYESDLGDGWEDPSLHKDPEAVRLSALQMGANLIQYAFEQ